VFNLADASMGLMATINLIAIVALSGTVVAPNPNNYDQRLSGVHPRFRLKDHPAMAKGVDPEIWN